MLATTLGETGGDAVSMSMNLGYLVGTEIFAGLFIVAVIAQISAKRSLGIGYAGGTAILFTMLMASQLIWYRTLGSVAVDTVSSPKSEMFYWITIMFCQTLGTALGDWTADTAGQGYGGGAMLFGALLAVIAIAYFRTKFSHTLLFWAAFILTRSLGAVVGDFLDKPISNGGLELSRYSASVVLFLLIVSLIFIFAHKSAKQGH
jgi:uncharacterized membrane-anchored protein